MGNITPPPPPPPPHVAVLEVVVEVVEEDVLVLVKCIPLIIPAPAGSCPPTVVELDVVWLFV